MTILRLKYVFKFMLIDDKNIENKRRGAEAQ